MDSMFVLGKNKWQIAPVKKIIKRDELERYYAANEILEASHHLAAQLEQQARDDHKRRYNEGYVEGVEAGKSEYSLKIMEMVMTQLDALENLENQIVDVVIASVHKIVDEIDDRELIVRVVRKGISAVRGEKRLLVRVSLADEATVSASLKSSIISADGMSGYLEVVGDSYLKQGDCIIETDMGVVEASLSTQLRILEQSLRSVVGKV